MGMIRDHSDGTSTWPAPREEQPQRVLGLVARVEPGLFISLPMAEGTIGGHEVTLVLGGEMLVLAVKLADGTMHRESVSITDIVNHWGGAVVKAHWEETLESEATVTGPTADAPR